MNSQLLIVLVIFLASNCQAGLDLSTCARMDIPVLSKIAAGLCISSCSAQNCGTGNCKKVRGRPTCYCYRCANGGNVPLGDVIGKKG